MLSSAFLKVKTSDFEPPRTTMASRKLTKGESGRGAANLQLLNSAMEKEVRRSGDRNESLKIDLKMDT